MNFDFIFPPFFFLEGRREVDILISENLLKYANFESELVLNPNEKRELKIIISVPKDMEYGNYSGKMRIFIYKL